MTQLVENTAKILQSVVLWALLLVIALSILSLGGNRPLVWSLMSLAVLLLFVLQLGINSLSRRPAPFDRLWLPGLLFLGTLAWATLQRSTLLPADWAHPFWSLVDSPGRVSADPASGGHAIMRLVTYALIFWIALRASTERKTARAVIKAFALFSIALALFGIHAWVTGDNRLLGSSADNRPLSASFMNRNSYATFAVFGMLANLALYAGRQGGGASSGRAALRDTIEGFFSGSWLWALGMILCGGALAIGQSRAGAIVAVVGLLAFLAAYRRGGRNGNLAALAIVVLGIAIAVGVTATGGLVERFLTNPGEGGRGLVYAATLEGIMDRPLLGHGLGAYEDAFRPYIPIEAAHGEWTMAHNTYLETIFELGLPAAAAFYLALLLIVRQIWTGLRERHRGRAVLAFVFGCVVAGALHAAADFSLQMPGIAASFALFLGIGYAQSFREAEMKPARRGRNRD